MSTSARMNVFLQRMLRRSDEEINEPKDSPPRVRGEEGPRAGSMGSSWIRKLGSSSPTKYSIATSPTLKILEGKNRRRSMPEAASRKPEPSPRPAPVMPDLETIIRDFETNFLSPKRSESGAPGHGSFVKKIVAAFEVKYKAYDQLRAEQEARETAREDDREGEGPMERSKESGRRSGIFASPFRSGRKDCDEPDESFTREKVWRRSGRRSGLFSASRSATSATRVSEDGEGREEVGFDGSWVTSDSGESADKPMTATRDHGSRDRSAVSSFASPPRATNNVIETSTRVEARVHNADISSEGEERPDESELSRRLRERSRRRSRLFASPLKGAHEVDARSNDSTTPDMLAATPVARSKLFSSSPIDSDDAEDAERTEAFSGSVGVIDGAGKLAKSKVNERIQKALARKSKLFSSPFKGARSPENAADVSCGDSTEKKRSESTDSEAQRGSNRKSGLFARPFKGTKDVAKNLYNSKGYASSFEIFNSPDASEKVRSSYRRSGLFSSPFKTGSGSPKSLSECRTSDSALASGEAAEKRIKCLVNGSKVTPDSVWSRKSQARSVSTESGRSRWSGAFFDPFEVGQEDASGTIFYSSTGLDEEAEIRQALFSSPFRDSQDDTKSLDSVDLSMTLTNFEDTAPTEPAEAENERTGRENREDHKHREDHKRRVVPEESGEEERREEASEADRTPRIVGAFLKRPIEVEDTAIDWIPITGKRLPRKRSLKKLLSTFALRRKSKVVFSSERNLREEGREFQDSGYDEKSSSSSSLTSLKSITEILLQQENDYVAPERRTTLRTFQKQSTSAADASKDEARKPEKRILFTDVRREDLKLDLGPSYPSAAIATMSLDRRTMQKFAQSPARAQEIPRLPKHPLSSKIPKHPFVSRTKLDDDREEAVEDVAEVTKGTEERIGQEEEHRVGGDQQTKENEETDEHSPVRTVRTELYEVEFRPSPTGNRSSALSVSSSSSSSSSSSESVYDVPRAHVSMSESEIPKLFRRSVAKRRDEHIYDVPKTRRLLERPRSSVFDDAVALKRRTANLEAAGNAPSFYALADDREPHYATVKPRTRRIHMSEQVLNSCGVDGGVYSYPCGLQVR